MMDVSLSGDKEVILNLLSAKSDTFRRVREAVEKTAVRMANHARGRHGEQGSDPHAEKRYRNRTANLTNSIFPGGLGGPMQWERVTPDEIVGLFGINAQSEYTGGQAEIGEKAVVDATPESPLKYGPYVEERYPFIFPAMVAYIDSFKKAVANAAPGGEGTMIAESPI